MPTITFRSPGTFVAEENTVKVSGIRLSTILKNAIEASKTILQRYEAIPYAFRYKKIWYYLPHCKVTAAKGIIPTKDNEILRKNCEYNNITHIVTPTKGWSFTQPFQEGNKLLNEDGSIKFELIKEKK